MDNFIEKVTLFSTKIQENRYISSITNGLISATTLLMVGSLFAILNSLPISAYQEWIISLNLKTFLAIPVNVTTNILSLYLVFIIAFIFVKKSNRSESLEVGLLALMSFFILTPFEVDENFAITSLSSQWFGASGMFTSFLVALAVASVCVTLLNKNLYIKMPEGVPEAISKTFSALVPGFIIAIVSLIVRIVFSFSQFNSLHNFIYGIIGIPLSKLGNSFWAFLLFVILIHVFWFIGIHGSLMVIGIVAPILMPLGIENLTAFNAGAPIPNILTTTFLFQSIGAVAGNTLGLVILMLFAKSKRYKTMGKIGIVPGLFSINEPILFGTPIIMNFNLLIPFIVVPVISFLGAYGLTLINILPRVNGVSVPTGVPIIVGGFMIGGLKWAMYQVVTTIISILIYYPFFKKMDSKELLLEGQN